MTSDVDHFVPAVGPQTILDVSALSKLPSVRSETTNTHSLTVSAAAALRGDALKLLYSSSQSEPTNPAVPPPASGWPLRVTDAH